ncbi:GPR1/FUN34/yaaH [Cordyceps fumosorosea ARSEF 2679]|uniref:GPR1/FUN34/yaaH n=1 Tax=Cordyceps fumosorosea (strain ARSEF 2679) TaxID=1081104 RepID=A0A168DAM8_CORFA|nr:GPR1/FUN34/yaaH [Cordyceps fumosorosea ARSEF 2679]OAA72367.1 GPR1/FUN34/yaaH [Cordyceps fumosorosea ARSEF 2679]
MAVDVPPPSEAAGYPADKPVRRESPVHHRRHLPSSAAAFPVGAFATTLTTLSLSLMEFRGVTITNVYVANFFFVAALGLVISAQWELSAGNGFAYTVYSAFVWTIFVFTFLVASVTSNLVNILIYLFVDLGFLFIAASYFAKADGHASAATGLQVTGGASCFIAGLLGWYLTFHLLLKDELVELPLGDTSKYFSKRRARRT